MSWNDELKSLTATGISNFFLLEKMYGGADVFTDSELHTLLLYRDDRAEIEIKTSAKMISQPKRWKYNSTLSEETYIYFTLQGVKVIELHVSMNYSTIMKADFGKIQPSIVEDSGNAIDRYYFELEFHDGQKFICRHNGGRIHTTSKYPHLKMPPW